MVCYRVLALLVLQAPTKTRLDSHSDSVMFFFFSISLTPRLIYGHIFAGGKQAWGCHGPGPAMENETDIVFPVAVLIPVLIVRLILRYIHV